MFKNRLAKETMLLDFKEVGSALSCMQRKKKSKDSFKNIALNHLKINETAAVLQYSISASK